MPTANKKPTKKTDSAHARYIYHRIRPTPAVADALKMVRILHPTISNGPAAFEILIGYGAKAVRRSLVSTLNTQAA